MGSALEPTRHSTCLIIAMLVALAAPSVAQTTEVPRATTAEIADLVGKLGDERYAVRHEATRRLCILGPQTADALKQAAEQGSGESALRANHLLAIFERCYFWGAEVELAFAKPKIRWDEPVDLLIILRNKAAHPVRLPFEPTMALPNTRLTDAQQVGVMFDVADFLIVTDPSDGLIASPTTDNLDDDPDVRAALDARAENGASSLLPPGQELTIRLENFNRGWSRYRMLDAGTYHVAFEFRPDWTDAELAESKVGYVDAKPASIEITVAAPPLISRDGADAGLEIIQEEKRITAFLVNHQDKPVLFNTGLGVAVPFAQFAWSCTLRDEPEVDIPLPGLKQSVSDFALTDLHEVAPGERLLIGETTVADLFADYARQSRGTPPDRLKVRATYNNIVTQNWQRRENILGDKSGAWPAVLCSPLPPRLVATRQSSESIAINAPPAAAVDGIE